MSDERVGELRAQLEAQDAALAEATSRMKSGQSAALTSTDLEQMDMLCRAVAPSAATNNAMGIRA